MCGHVPDGKSLDVLVRALAWAAGPVLRPIQQWRRRQADLCSFSTKFKHHPHDITQFVDYFAWHEDDSDWRQGNGALLCTTYGELFRFWVDPAHFVPYEARLARFMARGGTIIRLYVRSGEMLGEERGSGLLIPRRAI